MSDKLTKLSDDKLLEHFEGKAGFELLSKKWSNEDKELFCRLVRLVHTAEFDWRVTSNDVRFGRWNGKSRFVLCRIRWSKKSSPSSSRDRFIRVSFSPANGVGDLLKKCRGELSKVLLDNFESFLNTEHGKLPDVFQPIPGRIGRWPDQYQDDPTESDEDFDDEDSDNEEPSMNADVMPPLNIIYYGPPGTGKTRHLLIDIGAIDESASIDKNGVSEPSKKRQYAELRFVTFHQSYGYEEFVEGLRPVLKDETDSKSGDIQYEIRPGVFKELCDVARNNSDKHYAMIIDEINRGNISKIFGELITLIEPDKRDGPKRGISVILPYSGKPFSIPANVDIIGTMNIADRSLALLDTALRRRFEFKHLPPAPDLLNDACITKDNMNIDVVLMLTTINKRIEALYDRDHCIGHAYLIGLKDVANGKKRFDALTAIFRTRIIPLLEEYFFEDWEKIRLVLGDNQKDKDLQFVIECEDDFDDLFGTKHELNTDSSNRRYKVNKDAFHNPDAYTGIYERN